MLVECERCGAPLDIKGSERFAVCTYCRGTNRVQSLKTMSATTPADWRPPPEWKPPPHVSPTPLAYAPVRKAPGTPISSAVGVLAVLGGIGFCVYASKARKLSTHGMDPQASPLMGTVDLGTTPNLVLDRRGSIAGKISVGSSGLSGHCRGYVTAAPQFVLRVSTPQQVMLTTNATRDLTMLLHQPSGAYLCDDDSGEGTNPLVNATLTPGVYQLWIGTYSQSTTSDFTLHLETESLASKPLANGLAPDSPPSLGTIVLDDPSSGTNRSGMAGGRLDARTLGSNCRGWIPSVPHVVITAATVQQVSMTTTGTEDLTMVLRDSSGALRCDDDSGEGTNPLITASLTPGVYQVWVGTYHEGNRSSFGLTVATARGFKTIARPTGRHTTGK